MCRIDQKCIAGLCRIDLHVQRDKKRVSVCVPSLLESAIVFDTIVTVCMCMECMYGGGSIIWDTICSRSGKEHIMYLRKMQLDCSLSKP